MVFDSDIFNAMSIGLGAWLFTWGLNRVYLFVKKIVS